MLKSLGNIKALVTALAFLFVSNTANASWQSTYTGAQFFSCYGYGGGNLSGAVDAVTPQIFPGDYISQLITTCNNGIPLGTWVALPDNCTPATPSTYYTCSRRIQAPEGASGGRVDVTFTWSVMGEDPFYVEPEPEEPELTSIEKLFAAISIDSVGDALAAIGLAVIGMVGVRSGVRLVKRAMGKI